MSNLCVWSQWSLEFHFHQWRLWTVRQTNLCHVVQWITSKLVTLLWNLICRMSVRMQPMSSLRTTIQQHAGTLSKYYCKLVHYIATPHLLNHRGWLYNCRVYSTESESERENFCRGLLLLFSTYQSIRGCMEKVAKYRLKTDDAVKSFLDKYDQSVKDNWPAGCLVANSSANPAFAKFFGFLLPFVAVIISIGSRLWFMTEWNIV